MIKIKIKQKIYQLTTLTATYTTLDETGNPINAKISIISLNINGLFEDNKIKKLFDFLIDKKADSTARNTFYNKSSK